MEKNNFDRKVLEKIKEDKLQPLSRWHFVVKNYLVWVFGILALIASSAALSLMIYLFQFNDFTLSRQMNKSTVEILFLTLPYFWILFLAVAIFIVYYNVKHTKKGYRYPLWLVTVVVFSASILICALFCSLGWNERMDEMLGRKAPLYGKMMNPHVDFWSNPDDGRLVGLTASDLEENSFELVDRDGHIWLVSVDTNTEGTTFVISGRPVRMLGDKKSKKEFAANMILPLMPGRGFFQDLHPGSAVRLIMFEGGCTCGGTCSTNCILNQGSPCGGRYQFSK